jgi:uncharacterized membrane protein YbaN (DUF454 family)
VGKRKLRSRQASYVPPALPTEEFLVFTARCDHRWAEAERLVAGLPNARLIDSSSADLADLLAVARYDVVEPVCVVALHKGAVLYRTTRLPGPATLAALLRTCNLVRYS